MTKIPCERRPHTHPPYQIRNEIFDGWRKARVSEYVRVCACPAKSAASSSQLGCETCSLRAWMEKYDFWHFQNTFPFSRLFFSSFSAKVPHNSVNGGNLIVIHGCRRAQNTSFLFTTPSRLFFLMFNGDHSFVIIRKRNPFEWNVVFSAPFTCVSFSVCSLLGSCCGIHHPHSFDTNSDEFQCRDSLSLTSMHCKWNRFVCFVCTWVRMLAHRRRLIILN